MISFATAIVFLQSHSIIKNNKGCTVQYWEQAYIRALQFSFCLIVSQKNLSFNVEDSTFPFPVSELLGLHDMAVSYYLMFNLRQCGTESKYTFDVRKGKQMALLFTAFLYGMVSAVLAWSKLTLSVRKSIPCCPMTFSRDSKRRLPCERDVNYHDGARIFCDKIIIIVQSFQQGLCCESGLVYM